MAEAPGSDIGPYRVVAPIGSGGFATVYRARDDRLDSEVALKVLAENHSLDPDIRERFLGEAQLLRRIDSPCVVRVLDVGETERFQPYLVLEFAERGDLRRRVAEARADQVVPTAADVTRVVEALADGLAAVHAQGLVHRDVSPGNILLKVTATPLEDVVDSTLVAADERILLADLGYAKDLAAHSGLTVGGGTQGFRAPEQRSGLGSIDHRADVYAASALIAWLGISEDPEAIPARDPAGHLRRAGMEARLAVALGTGLAHDPRKRQADMSRWRADVLAALAPPPVPDAGEERPARPRRRRMTLVLTVAALVVALALGAGAATLVAGDDPAPTTTTLEDGRVRVSAEEGDVAAAIFGPDQVAVGETATFEAGATGAAAFAWVTPDGALVDGAESLDVRLDDAGPATVRLVVTGADGTVVTVTLDLEVTP